VGFAQPLSKLRGIAAACPNFTQIAATADSGIKTVADLSGKSLSVGAPKSGTGLIARVILEAPGMAYTDMAKVEYLPFAEPLELQKNRQLDATLQSAGMGVASIKDLATAMPTQIVAIPADVVKNSARLSLRA
jgi:TRAP transporter TAXI family solute receptor